MPKGLFALAFTGLLACAGCAARVEPARPQAQPKAPAEPAREVPTRPVNVPSGSGTPAGTPRTAGAPAPAPAVPSAAAAKPASDDAPPATASAYVFSPQQAASARPGTSSQGGAPLAPLAPGKAPAVPNSPPASPSQASPPPSPAPSAAPVRGELQLVLVASAPSIAAGAVVTVDVMASASAAVVDAPLHVSFDPTVLEFVNGVPGDFLTQGGSSVVFFADGRSRPGDVAIAAGRVERGQGAVGSGLLCRMQFRGIARGASSLVVGQAKAWGTHGEELAVATSGARVVVD